MPQRFIAGVDLGGTHVRVAIANEDGEIEARRVTPYDGGDPERLLATIRRTADDLVRSVWPGADVAGIGMALPGTVNPARGTVATRAPLPVWKRRVRRQARSPRPNLVDRRCQRATARERRRRKSCGSWAAGARERAHAGGTWLNFGVWSVASLGHLPSCLFGGGLCPCAGYFSLDFELVSVVLIEPIPQ